MIAAHVCYFQSGLFLFLPMLASIPLDRILEKSEFPGSEMIPPGSAMRSLLALKLFGTAPMDMSGAWSWTRGWPSSPA